MICDKLTKKMILILIFSLISCIIFMNTTYAANDDLPTIDEMLTSADEFLSKGQDNVIKSEEIKGEATNGKTI